MLPFHWLTQTIAFGVGISFNPINIALVALPLLGLGTGCALLSPENLLFDVKEGAAVFVALTTALSGWLGCLP